MENVNMYKKLVAFISEIPQIEKNAANPFFKSKYTTLDRIYEVIAPIMKKHNVSVIHEVNSSIDNEQSIVEVIPIVLFDSGEVYKGGSLKAIAPSDIQKLGAAITYLKRYTISAMLGITADEDDDGNIANGNVQAPAQPAKAKNSYTKTEKQHVTPQVEAKTLTVKESEQLMNKAKVIRTLIDNMDNMNINQVYLKVKDFGMDKMMDYFNTKATNYEMIEDVWVLKTVEPEPVNPVLEASKSLVDKLNMNDPCDIPEYPEFKE